MEIRKVLDDYCDTATLWEVFEEVENLLGTDELLLALAKAMGTDELHDNLKYIARVYDLQKGWKKMERVEKRTTELKNGKKWEVDESLTELDK